MVRLLARGRNGRDSGGLAAAAAAAGLAIPAGVNEPHELLLARLRLQL